MTWTDQDFDSLSPEQLAELIAEAAAAYVRKHGTPMPANSGRYLRKRHHLLQQRAKRTA